MSSCPASLSIAFASGTGGMYVCMERDGWMVHDKRQERLRGRQQGEGPAKPKWPAGRDILVVYIRVTTVDDKYDCIARRCFSSADGRRRAHSPAGRPAPDPTYAPLRSVYRYANGPRWLPWRPVATYATASIRVAGPRRCMAENIYCQYLFH